MTTYSTRIEEHHSWYGERENKTSLGFLLHDSWLRNKNTYETQVMSDSLILIKCKQYQIKKEPSRDKYQMMNIKTSVESLLTTRNDHYWSKISFHELKTGLIITW